MVGSNEHMHLNNQKAANMNIDKHMKHMKLKLNANIQGHRVTGLGRADTLPAHSVSENRSACEPGRNLGANMSKEYVFNQIGKINEYNQNKEKHKLLENYG